MSVPKKAPIPWDATAPYKGLGFRDIEADVKKADYEMTELPVVMSTPRPRRWASRTVNLSISIHFGLR